MRRESWEYSLFNLRYVVAGNDHDVKGVVMAELQAKVLPFGMMLTVR
jgi:hypothetical protein